MFNKGFINACSINGRSSNELTYLVLVERHKATAIVPADRLMLVEQHGIFDVEKPIVFDKKMFLKFVKANAKKGYHIDGKNLVAGNRKLMGKFAKGWDLSSFDFDYSDTVGFDIPNGMLEKFLPFCANDQSRPSLEHIRMEDGRVSATNGYYCLVAPIDNKGMTVEIHHINAKALIKITNGKIGFCANKKQVRIVNNGVVISFHHNVDLPYPNLNPVLKIDDNSHLSSFNKDWLVALNDIKNYFTSHDDGFGIKKKMIVNFDSGVIKFSNTNYSIGINQDNRGKRELCCQFDLIHSTIKALEYGTIYQSTNNQPIHFVTDNAYHAVLMPLVE